jgi:uncharacterized protein with HEPN domain
MRRSVEAYLADIIDSCVAIEAALTSVDLDAYLASRLVRSSVEREFIIIGEATGSLSRLDPELAASITHARFIVGFRNRLAHDYASIDDEAVFRIAQHDVGPLQAECETLLARVTGGGGAD